MPDTTVILTVAAGEAAIDQTMASVLEQTGDFDVIVVDDASGLASPSSDPRVTIVRNDQAVGRARCLNQALEIAGGTHLVLVRAGDRLGPGFLAGMLHSLQAWDVLGTGSSHDAASWIWENPVGAPVVVRSAVFDAVGPFSEDFTVAPEWDLWVRALAAGFSFGAGPEAAGERAGPAISVAEYALISERHLHPFLTRIGRRDLIRRNVVRFLSHPDVVEGTPDFAATIVGQVLAPLPLPDQAQILQELGQRVVAAEAKVAEREYELQATLDRLGAAEIDRRVAQDELARWQATFVYRAARKAKRSLSK